MSEKVVLTTSCARCTRKFEIERYAEPGETVVVSEPCPCGATIMASMTVPGELELKKFIVGNSSKTDEDEDDGKI